MSLAMWFLPSLELLEMIIMMMIEFVKYIASCECNLDVLHMIDYKLTKSTTQET